MREIFMQVKDMKCTGCEATIRKQLLKLDGIYDAHASFKTGKLCLNVTPEFQPLDALTSMAEVGYTLEADTEG